MKMHPRHTIVNEARAEFNNIMLNLFTKYELTDGEILSIISEYLSTQAKYIIRYERNSNHQQEGDIIQE